MIYLSSPYTSDIQKNFEQNIEAVGAMFRNAQKLNFYISIFSPVIQDHNIYENCNFSDEEKYLNYHNYVNWGILDKSECMIVLTLDGWENSTGVKLEIEYANQHNIHIEYLSLSDIKNCNDRVQKILEQYKK